MQEKKKINFCSDGSSLEAEANKLLKPFLSKKEGIYTDKQLDRIKRNKECSIDDCDINIPVSKEIDALFDCLWAEIMSGAKKTKCSQLQIDILSFRRFGMSSRDIASALKDTHKVSYKTVQRELKVASDKIQSTDAFGIMSVLAEVFKCSVEKIKAILFYR